MICGNTSDFIDHPLPKHFVSAYGASHHAWVPSPLPSKSGAVIKDLVQRGPTTSDLRAVPGEAFRGPEAQFFEYPQL